MWWNFNGSIMLKTHKEIVVTMGIWLYCLKNIWFKINMQMSSYMC